MRSEDMDIQQLMNHGYVNVTFQITRPINMNETKKTEIVNLEKPEDLMKKSLHIDSVKSSNIGYLASRGMSSE